MNTESGIEESQMIFSPAVLRRFDRPEEAWTFKKVSIEIVRLGGMTIARTICHPGWRWSTDIGSRLELTKCTVEHAGMVLSGACMTEFSNGRVIELHTGELFYIPPIGHDSCVVGDQNCVCLHFLGAEEYLCLYS